MPSAPPVTIATRPTCRRPGIVCAECSSARSLMRFRPWSTGHRRMYGRSSKRARGLAAFVLGHVLRHLPRPQLDAVPGGIVEVCGQAAALAVSAVVRHEDVDAVALDPFDGRVEHFRGEVQDVVDMDTALSASEPDHRLPQADA